MFIVLIANLEIQTLKQGCALCWKVV